MKKILLFSAMLAVTTAAFAQSRVEKAVLKSEATRNVMERPITDKPLQASMATVFGSKKQMKKVRYTDSGDTIVIYNRPEGAFYGKNMYPAYRNYYLWSQLSVAPWVDFTFDGFARNVNSTATPKWMFYSSNSMGIETVEEATEDDGEIKTEGNRTSFTTSVFPLSCNYRSPFSYPTLVLDKDSTSLGEYSYYWSLGYHEAYMSVPDSLFNMSVWDPNFIWGHFNDGSPVVSYYWFGVEWNKDGSLKAYNYAYGSMNADMNGDGVYDARQDGFVQVMDKPMAPLYIDAVEMDALSAIKGKMIADGNVLTLNIRKVNYVTKQDETTGEEYQSAELGDIIETFTCSKVTDSETEDGWEFGTLVFNKTEEDPFDGSLHNVPVVLIDEFAFEFKGFAQDGVDVNIPACYQRDEDELYGRNPIYFQLKDLATGEVRDLSYKSAIIPCFSMHAIYDGIDVLTDAYDSEGNVYHNFNVLTISSEKDEETGSYYGITSSGDPYTLIYTVQLYTDTITGVPNYDFAAVEGIIAADGKETVTELNYVPDWLMIEGYDNYHDIAPSGTSYGNGMVIVQAFTDETLPQGVKGRYVKLTIKGKGVQSADPIIVIQGDVDLNTLGLSSLQSNGSAEGKTFNLAGQRVNENAKGLLIRDGKKFFRK